MSHRNGLHNGLHNGVIGTDPGLSVSEVAFPADVLMFMITQSSSRPRNSAQTGLCRGGCPFSCPFHTTDELFRVLHCCG